METEPPFSGIYWDCKKSGIYRCIACNQPLFSSESKYDSGTGWPSFFEPIDPKAIAQKIDRSHGMVRMEISCSNCGAHLGHLFPDGPPPTGERYCVNSKDLNLEEN